VGDGSWTVPSACDGRALSLRCSIHGPMGGNDRFTFDSSCSSRRMLEEAPTPADACAALERVDDCRFDGWGDPRQQQGLSYDEAYAACCASCVEGCVGFSIETTHTTLRATNRTQRIVHSCVRLRKGEDFRDWKRRERQLVAGGARITRSNATCYVPPRPPPTPVVFFDEAPLPSPGRAPYVLVDGEVFAAEYVRQSADADADADDWWFQMVDLEDDHRAPWMNRTPVPKHRWHATVDAFDRF